MLEVSVEGVAAVMSKGKPISFEIYGDGNLPRVNILKPTTTNKKGYPIMLFNK